MRYDYYQCEWFPIMTTTVEPVIKIPPGQHPCGDAKIEWTIGRRQELPMADLTLESLAKRIEALEIAVSGATPVRAAKDWRKVVGMFRESDFMRQVDEECARSREAERDLARQSEPPA
jgi:hypothetical protein